MELHCTHPTPLATEAKLSSKQEGVCGRVGDKASAVFENKTNWKKCVLFREQTIKKKKKKNPENIQRKEKWKSSGFWGEINFEQCFWIWKTSISLDASQAFSPKVRGLEHSPGLLGGSWRPKWTNTCHSFPGKPCRAGRNPVLTWVASRFRSHSWPAVLTASSARWSQNLRLGYGPQSRPRLTLVSGVCLGPRVTAHARTLRRLRVLVNAGWLCSYR